MVSPVARAGGLPLAALQQGAQPTPLQELRRLNAHLGGARLWVKRDDLTGLALGGSKTRALGTLLGSALAQGADTLVTCGPTTSNHVRLTAAAGNQLGLRVVLVLQKPKGAADAAQGNMLLNHMLGAELVFEDSDSLAGLDPAMERVAAGLRQQGAKPFIIPGGGYSPTGAAGYIALVQELIEQAAAGQFKMDAVVFASGSGCIQSGVLLGCLALGADLPVYGVTINRSVAELTTRIAHDVEAASRLVGLDLALPPQRIQVLDQFLGSGYAIPSEKGMAAMDLLARLEGLLLDPCYTSKSMAAAMHLAVHRFRPGQNIVFIHTGGTPGIFSYASAIQSPTRRPTHANPRRA